jgi:hypothetical protein
MPLYMFFFFYDALPERFVCLLLNSVFVNPFQVQILLIFRKLKLINAIAKHENHNFTIKYFKSSGYFGYYVKVKYPINNFENIEVFFKNKFN